MADHKCLLPFCKELAPIQYATCRTHFDILPRAYNDAIRATYSAGATYETASPALMRALTSAHAWIHETFNTAPREKWDPGKWERLCRMVRERDRVRAELRKALGLPKPPHLRLV